MKLFPKPQFFSESNVKIENALIKKIDLGKFDSKTIRDEFLKANPDFIFDSPGDITYVKDSKLGDEEYKIKIKDKKIIITCSTKKSAFYATISFLRLYEEDLYELELHDYPTLKIRGVMLDISRNKVPTLKTLKEIVYNLAHMKINHLELYVEGMSLEFKSFKEEIEIYHNYFSLKDYKALEKYCHKYFIDLVPNLNGCGHMSDWLAVEKYLHLAEKEDGFRIWQANRSPSTLNVTDPESIEFVDKLYNDLLPITKSKYFNMNLDEPLELGLGKNKELVEKYGKEKIYLDYVLKLADIVKNKYHKIPMMWGDMLVRHPDVLKDIDRDIIFIDWGYDHIYDFEKHSQMLEEEHISFMNAPGTCTWGNIVGKDIDMNGSIRHAATACKNHHGLGLLVTDWGDIGHLQFFVSSYPGIILSAGESWNELSDEELKGEVCHLLGEDIGNIVLKLQTYPSLDEYRGYGSKLFTPIIYAEHARKEKEPINYYRDVMSHNVCDKKQYLKYKAFFKDCLIDIKKLKPSLIKQELGLAVKLLLILNDVCHELYFWLNNKQYNFDKIIDNLSDYSTKYEKLWNKRNNRNGFVLSNNRIEWLKLMLNEIKREENK